MAPAVVAGTPASSPASTASDVALAVGLARRHRAAIVGLGLAVAAAVAWWTLGTAGTTNPGPPEVSLQPLTFHGQAGDATISPDGRAVVFPQHHLRPAILSSVLEP